MKGYKGMNLDMTCRGFQYELGKTYKMDGEISLCERGFHFCENLMDVFGYYDRNSYYRFFEIEASGRIINGEDKSVSSEISILRELSSCEIYRAAYAYGGKHGDKYRYGDGHSNGNGDGYGYGDGYACRNGDGYGDGNGDEHGCGYGHGHGNMGDTGHGDGNMVSCGNEIFLFK